MKKVVAILILFLFACISVFPQVGINTDGTQPALSAGLDVKFTDKGFLPPRMTIEQRNAILNPAEGLIVTCANCSSAGNPVLSIFLAGKWQNVSSLCETPSAPAAGTHI